MNAGWRTVQELVKKCRDVGAEVHTHSDPVDTTIIGTRIVAIKDDPATGSCGAYNSLLACIRLEVIYVLRGNINVWDDVLDECMPI